MYTLIVMSSGGKSVRQHAITHWHVLLFAVLIFAAVVGTFGGIGYGLFQKKREMRAEAELQKSLERIESLDRERLIINTKLENVEEEMQNIREMANKVKEGLGILGQGGGIHDPVSVSENGSDFWADNGSEVVESDSYYNEVASPLIPDQVREEILPLYDYVVTYEKLLNEYPSILPIQLESKTGAEKQRYVFWYSSRFGMRVHPLTRKREFHYGLDIKTRSGAPVIAAAAGFITKVTRDPYLGKMVEVHHKSQKLKTIYAHLKDYAAGLKKGQEVSRGQIIGYVGSTGRSTGPHLHYGVYDTRRGKWVNPIGYILDQQPTFSP